MAELFVQGRQQLMSARNVLRRFGEVWLIILWFRFGFGCHGCSPPLIFAILKYFDFERERADQVILGGLGNDFHDDAHSAGPAPIQGVGKQEIGEGNIGLVVRILRKALRRFDYHRAVIVRPAGGRSKSPSAIL